jgi:hypothetical protein
VTQFEINYLKKTAASANGSNPQKPYCQSSNSVVVDATHRFYQTDPLVMTERKLCAIVVGLPHSTSANYFGYSCLKVMKEKRGPLVAAAREVIMVYLDKMTKQKVWNAGKLQ